ncbi:MAG: YbjN domain-containing protein [Cyanobacteriota/Melainabacteria group bacterium]|nr:YbjN domain-containing protein [Cyanobacteria bacterium HKST-UBA01]MCB9470351.1 YbjN domain-containing protein [Candidatus Obscuribacterales bacterium]HMO24048.1 YbjN domain-containing protein [Candidatus Melainabacteria bacterium]
MGLFGTQKISQGQAQDAVAMVEQYFRRRGLDPNEHCLKDAAGYGWWITEGSAKIYVFIQDSPHGAVLRITSPLVFLPQDNRESCYRKLLDLNSNLSSCALSTHDDIVLVVAQRPTFGLVQEELDDLVWHVAYVADLLDNKLADEFGCQMYTDEAAASRSS